MSKKIILVGLIIFAIVAVCWYSTRSSGDLKLSQETISQARKLLIEAELHRKSGRYEEAATSHNEALKITNKAFIANFLEERHSKSVKAVDDTTQFIRQGDLLVRAERFEDAIAAYRQAYEHGGDYVTSGFELVKVYEKLGRFDEGIGLLDEMVSKGYLSPNGVARAHEIKARLISTKAVRR
jgi:pentatricopeptide repeat protein